MKVELHLLIDNMNNYFAELDDSFQLLEVCVLNFLCYRSNILISLIYIINIFSIAFLSKSHIVNNLGFVGQMVSVTSTNEAQKQP